MSGISQIGELSIKLADAALKAREKGDDVNAIFFAIKAAQDTLEREKDRLWVSDSELVRWMGVPE